MRFLEKFDPRVPKIALLLIAGLVWCFAGIKVLSMGLPDMLALWQVPIIHLLLAAVVGLLFFKMFHKLVHKHDMRIKKYEKEKICLFAFFDWQSYAIMAFMMTGGILLRSSHLVNPLYLGTAYTGIGSALLLAGICFIYTFGKNLRNRQAATPQAGA